MAQLTGDVKRHKKISSKFDPHKQWYLLLDSKKCKTDPYIKRTQIKNVENRQIIKPTTPQHSQIGSKLHNKWNIFRQTTSTRYLFSSSLSCLLTLKSCL